MSSLVVLPAFVSSWVVVLLFLCIYAPTATLLQLPATDTQSLIMCMQCSSLVVFLIVFLVHPSDLPRQLVVQLLVDLLVYSGQLSLLCIFKYPFPLSVKL